MNNTQSSNQDGGTSPPLVSIGSGGPLSASSFSPKKRNRGQLSQTSPIKKYTKYGAIDSSADNILMVITVNCIYK